MIKFYTSYFYKLRFFEPSDIPISTALWDPKWYHDFQGKDYIFVDKRGVINGLRAEFLAPGNSCDGLCQGVKDCAYTPDSCDFLSAYTRQLHTLNFNKVIEVCEATARRVQDYIVSEREPSIILMFHEKPDTLCSERIPVQRWFSENGVNITEWGLNNL